MITIYTTRYSVYEVDEEKRLMRRTHGSNPPKRGEDGVWQPYETLTKYYNGLMFTFYNGAQPMLTSQIRCSLISQQ